MHCLTMEARHSIYTQTSQSSLFLRKFLDHYTCALFVQRNIFRTFFLARTSMNRSQDKGLAKHDFSSVKMHTFFSLTLQSASLMVLFYAKLMGFDVCAFVSRTQKSNQRQRVLTDLSPCFCPLYIWL